MFATNRPRPLSSTDYFRPAPGWKVARAGFLLSLSLLLAAPQVRVLGADEQKPEPTPQPAPDAKALRQQMDRGRLLYVQNCLVCHQVSGQGVSGVYPPLAKADFLMEQKERSIRALCEGLSGEITVNGQKYDGIMPVMLLDDTQVADVLTYARNSWGNSSAPITPDEVKTVRAKTGYATFEALKQIGSFAPLPQAPPGFALREVVKLPQHGNRMASDGTGKTLYLLCGGGDIWRLDPASSQLRQTIWAKTYLEQRPGDLGGPVFVLGLAMDKQKRLYILSNQQNKSTLPVQNIVTVYRTTTFTNGNPVEPKPWLQVSYPGNSSYLHGAEHLAFGPDGFLYIGNGARTDANQSNPDPNYYSGGETPITACIWRVDPSQEKPDFEVFARGIRNAYGFCWNTQGEMFATENGPDAHAPEELNLIEKGKHYGFPYQFADWTQKAYSHTPDPPPGLEFTLPIPNLGPAGGFDGKPISTFDPHSSPGGIVYLDDRFPEGYRGTFLLTRFGNFIREPKDNVGFDVLHVTLRKNTAGTYEAKIETLLAPLGRPIDIHVTGKGAIYICEYSRPTNNHLSFSLPGRILELTVKK